MSPRGLSWTACAVAAGAGAWVLLVRANDPLATLQRTTHRPIAPRLSGLPYAPTASVPVERDLRVHRAASDIAARHSMTADADSYHQMGIAHIALGKLDDAVAALTAAAEKKPDSAAILSDLAAAQIAAGKLAAGAETAARAMSRDPRLTAAAFNWALALEELGNAPQAIRAWRRYLDHDDDEEWKHEARARLRELEKPRESWDVDRALLRGAVRADLVRHYPQRARYWIQDEILPRWAASGEPGHLLIARQVAAVRAADGDPFLHDVVEHAASRRSSVREGFELFADARRIAASRDMERAAPRFDEAIAALERAGSPLRLAARSFAASNDFYRSDYAAALRHVDEIDRELALAGHRYRGIAAESGWRRALVFARTGDGREIELLRRARASAVEAHESEHVLAIDMLLASAVDRAGQPGEGDAIRWEALRRLSDLGGPADRTASFHGGCALSSLRQRRPRLALAFLEGMLEMPVVRQDPLLVAEGEAWRAQALYEIGDRTAADAAIEHARRSASRVSTPALRDRVASDIDFVAGVAALPADPSRAATHLTMALQTYERREWRIRAARTLLARGNAHRTLGDHAAAERDYRAGIEQMERQRTTFAEPAFRVAYFEDSGDLFQNLIELLLGQSRSDAALDVAERKRARWLLDHLSNGTHAEPFTSRELAARLPEGTALLHYSLLRDRAAIWLVLPNRVLHARSSAPATRIREAAERFRRALVNGETSGNDGRWLFAQLIEPIRRELPAGTRLAIVPDGELSALPFAALQAQDGRYLIEEHALSLVPSGTTLVRSAFRPGPPRHVLSASAPGVDETLARLVEADAEAEAIAGMYPRAEWIKEPELTPERFLAAARSADVVHFAGHARDAELLFANGRLSAAEISMFTFDAHPLVVLSACSTARGMLYRNEGVDSLAAAFLHSGARGVIATLWNIEDRDSSRLSRAFHEELRRGTDAAEALRRVQRSMIASPSLEKRNPAAWAGMVLTGRG